jgi:N-acyl homoserine lactone hydrolase
MARRTAMFRDRDWTESLPIHAWLIQHDDGPILVDTGELADTRNTAFARFTVGEEDEIQQALAGHGLAPGDLRSVVLTHVHSDHANGLARLPGAPVVVGDTELRFVRSVGARATRLLLRQPLPSGFAPRPVGFDGPPIGAFKSSHLLTEDGRVRLVPAPGHTPGHAAVLVDRGDHHVLLCGDAGYDVEQIVDRHVDGISPDENVARATMDVILEHARRHPTVVLPSHDRRAMERLAQTEVLKSP